MSIPDILVSKNKRFVASYPTKPHLRSKIFTLVDRLALDENSELQDGNFLIKGEKPFEINHLFVDVNNNEVDGREQFEVAPEWFLKEHTGVEILFIDG
jgi:hypothetical protein